MLSSLTDDCFVAVIGLSKQEDADNAGCRIQNSHLGFVHCVDRSKEPIASKIFLSNKLMHATMESND
jgi:hypothetical protein